jgi:hypothetical protein
VIRFFAMAHDPIRGSHLHLVWTAYHDKPADCLREMRQRIEAGVVSMRPLFFDRGPGDTDLHRIDKVFGAEVFA